MTTTAAANLPMHLRNPADIDGTIDRAFIIQMAQIPFISLVLVACCALGHAVWAAFAPAEATMVNHGPIVVICLAMILAAVIDGWAFKVPNWLTLSLVVSGWMLGGLHDLGAGLDAGRGGFGSAMIGTCVGFLLLFFILAIGGMGAGDVKMQMGFGAWVGAFYGYREGAEIILYAFVAGVVVGGVFGIVMMACRRNFHRNLSNFKEIGTDLKVLVTMGPGKAAERANGRRATWVRLPYGVPLCIGFLGYLGYLQLNGELPTW